ncbi:MAG: flagellar hook-basal body complex protein [Cellvibrionaceae bacterium]|nr:flagellar hook-basal body complex protein [Cellvibrionaceae bacterium]
MPFDIALSGIRSASNDLSITGNNIANASTTGFKSSRAEFGDVYATSVLGAGNNSVGNGVRLQDVSQRFTQGSIAFTENELDLAVNGNGFFVVRREGEQYYTRAGAFGLDRDGFITSNTGARLQGFQADERGQIGGLQSDIRIQANNLSPRSTTMVETRLNLDSAEDVLQSTGTNFRTEGNAVAISRVGLQESTSTSYETPNFTLQPPIDLTNGNIGFTVDLAGSSGHNGTVNVLLNTAAGVPSTISSFNDLRTLAGVINAQLFQPTAPQTPIDVIATAVDAGGGQYRLEFTSLQEGEASEIRISNGTATAASLGLPVGPAEGISDPGIAAVSNGYPQQSIDIVGPDGNIVTYTSAANASAATIGSELNALAGVTATATTTLRFVANNFNNANGNLQVELNGVTLSAMTLEGLGQAINGYTASTLPGISAEVDAVTGDLVVSSSVGDDLRVSISSTDDGDSVEILGNPNAPAEVLEVDNNGTLNIANATVANGNEVVVGGSLNIVLAEGYSATNASPPSIGLFGPLTGAAFTEVVINEFDPEDKGTYNHATSMRIYDSLGNPHVLTQYFVRQEYDVNDAATHPNHWVMYVQIDGRDVGDPNTTLPPPDNTVPTRAGFDLRFNPDGSLNQVLSDQILISNWVPRDANGDPNGALGPQNVLAGGTSNIPDPPSSSNFVMDLAGTTQYGSQFSVHEKDQNGYTTGRLSGLNIDASGVIFARFTNGESMTLGQVILADFANNQGLQPVGDSMWAENFESGQPNIGTPGSAALGAIQAGALEESNVDLSEELVRLIIAQRNFQASAKTIETANQVTQTVINLR